MLYESLNVSLNSSTLHRLPDKNHVRFLRSAVEKVMKWILSFCLLIKINFSLIKQFRSWQACAILKFRSWTWLKESFLHRGWLHLAFYDFSHSPHDRKAFWWNNKQLKRTNLGSADRYLWKLFRFMGLIYSIFPASCNLGSEACNKEPNLTVNSISELLFIFTPFGL